jgi:hypothetical protein
MAQKLEQGACCMTVKALIPVRIVNLVAPLAAPYFIAHHAICMMDSANSVRNVAPHTAIGYTTTVSAKKALIGCRSPLARGAEPHPARFAAFLFRCCFGGPNGRAQALPVTLRVPRSPTPVRAAAQCRSWSAVVHPARLETNMADIIAHPRARTERVVQTRIRGRLPKAVPSLWKVRHKKNSAAYEAEEITKEIASYNDAIGRATQYIGDCKLTILRLCQKRKEVSQ